MSAAAAAVRRWVRGYGWLIALLLAFGVFRGAIADWNAVPTGSMLPTIQEGDVVLVNRLSYDLKLPLTRVVLARLGEPARGDIAVLRSPRDDTRLVKRVVALPGDTVSLRDKVLWINGVAATYAPAAAGALTGADALATPLRETVGERAHLVQWLPPAPGDVGDFGPIQVPADRYLVLGDNRDASADSRVFGLVPREQLVGRVSTVLLSIDAQRHWRPRTERFGLALE